MGAPADRRKGGVSTELLVPKQDWSRQMRNSFRNSVKIAAKEAEQLEKQTWAVIKGIPEALLQGVAHLLFPLLLVFDFVHFVRHMFSVGWQVALSRIIFDFLDFIQVALKLFGELFEKEANKLLTGYEPVMRIGLSDEDIASLKLYEPELLQSELDLTTIGLLDKCMALQSDTVKYFPSPSASSRPNADVCVMASKIAYESKPVVRNVVNHLWNTKWVEDGKVKDIHEPLKEKFEFLRWFSYARRKQSEKSNKPDDDTVDSEAIMLKRGEAIIVAFRGTEPFSAVDWKTDFYFPWWEFPALGRVHQGFLQGLGLGFPEEPKGHHQCPHPTGGSLASSDQNELDSAKQAESERLDDFSQYIGHCMTRFRAVAERSTLVGEPPEHKQTQFKKIEKDHDESLKQFLKKHVLVKDLNAVRGDAPLYWQIREALLAQLRAQPQAQIFITGHSLGGALAALFAGLLAAECDEITQRIAALHTFGQPRVGDWTFAWFLHNRMNVPEHRYMRMIYGYDLVPHVPFDADPFEFKHLGPFHWANAHYHIKIGTFDEQPGLNPVRAYLTAWFEVVYNSPAWCALSNLLFRPYPYHRSLESWPQVLARVAVVMFPFLPMFGAHNPINYVNAVRHGMPVGKTKTLGTQPIIRRTQTF